MPPARPSAATTAGRASPKNFQLDLFTPDDGHFSYYAVATNLPLALSALYAFIGGRGAQQKTIAELKGEFGLDVVPTRHYTANCAWQQLSVLAYNVARSFQLDTIAAPRRRSPRRTYAYVVRGMCTLRFLLIARAGRVTQIGGRPVSRLAKNPATEALYTRIQQPPNLFSDWGCAPSRAFLLRVKVLPHPRRGDA